MEEDVPVIEVGSIDDIIGCASNRTIESAILILGSNKFRRLPITKLGKIEGILTITDIFGIIAKVGMQQAFQETVGTWMTTNPKKIDLNATVLQSIKKMCELKIGSLLLVDEDNPDLCKGILTERDILYYYNSEKWKNMQIRDLNEKYTKLGFQIIDYDTSLEEAIRIMSNEHTLRLIVRSKEGDGIYGILSANDITRLITNEREEINNNANFLNSINAGFVSTGQLVTVNEDSSLESAVIMMRKHKFGAIPIIGADGQINGMISERSLLFFIAETET